MKIVIAEDEESVQQGMDEMLHMINPDYELIGTVTDEQSGMELIRKKQPDLVIIDVDLSGGRGLEMLGRLRKEGNACEALILTENAEFSSVRTAMELGVVNYLLKPVRMPELSGALKRAEMRFKKKQMEKERYSLERILEAALAGQAGCDEHVEEILRLNEGFDVRETLGIFVVWLGDAYKEYAAAVEDGLKRLGVNSGLFGNCTFNYPDKRLVLTVLYHLKSMEETVSYLRRNIVPMLEAQTKKKAVAAFRFCEGIDELQKASAGVYGILDYNITIGRNTFLEYDQVKKMKLRPLHYPIELENRVKTAVLNRDEKEFARCCEAFFDERTIRGCEPREVKEACLRYSYIVLNSAKTEGILNMKKQPVQILFQSVENAVTADEIKGAFREFFQRILPDREYVAEEKKGLLAERTKRLIAEYYNQGLTLQEAARKLGVSDGYLSTMIRKETGATFSEIIRTYRIDKVKALLLSTDLKLNQIAEQAGYANPKYMSKVFKEKTGMLPLEYRKRNL